MHEGECVTIFSAPNYCLLGNNKGAYMTVTDIDTKDEM
jgi:hypothetical protein